MSTTTTAMYAEILKTRYWRSNESIHSDRMIPSRSDPIHTSCCKEGVHQCFHPKQESILIGVRFSPDFCSVSPPHDDAPVLLVHCQSDRYIFPECDILANHYRFALHQVDYPGTKRKRSLLATVDSVQACGPCEDDVTARQKIHTVEVMAGRAKR